MSSRVGLTGGIGSGKSTVARLFRQLGIDTIDADQVARDLTLPGSPEYELVIATFGDGIIDHSGVIDRAKLGEIVFENDEKRKALESILHPPIRQTMLERSRQSAPPYCILEIPLLIESGRYTEMDRILVVTCKTDIRKKRLQQDRKLSLHTIDHILDAQLSDPQRSAKADDLIANDSTIEALNEQVIALHKQYCTMFRVP